MLLRLIEEHDSIDELNAIATQCGLAELGRLACINRFFEHAISSRSNHVWDAMCGQTWAGKVHVAQGAVDLRGMASSAREALRLSLADARRTELTDEELVAFEWRFRFKEQAGPQWQLHDPYWTKHEASLVKFTPSRRRSPGRLHILNFPLVEDFDLRWSWIAMQRAGRSTRVLQVNVNGSPVPSYVISRHADNWGWVMQSCWVVYLSFEMPRPGVDPTLDDEGLGLGVDAQLREVMAYNGYFDESEEEEDGEEDDYDEEGNDDDDEEEEEDEGGEEEEEGEEGEEETTGRVDGESDPVPEVLASEPSAGSVHDDIRHESSAAEADEEQGTARDDIPATGFGSLALLD